MTKVLGGLQIVALTLQGSTDFLTILPPKYHPLFHVVLAVVQALGWWVQRGYNSDGTPQTVAYTPKP